MKKKIWIASAAGLVVVLAVFLVVIWLNQPYVVGISYRDNAGQSNESFRTALEDALIAQGIQVIVMDANGDQAMQLEQVKQLQERKCHALIIEPVMKDAGDALMEAINTAGLPAVIYNRELNHSLPENNPKAAYIGVDEKQSGGEQGKLVLQLPDHGDLNGDGVVSCLLIQGPEDHENTTLRTDALRQVLEAEAPEVEYLAQENGDWTKESGRKLCGQKLAQFGKDIEVILCGNDQMAMGAVQAITDGGRTVGKDVYLFGIDGDPEALQMVSEGLMTGTVCNDQAAQIKAIVQTVIAQMENEPVEGRQIIPYVPVTAQNAALYMP